MIYMLSEMQRCVRQSCGAIHANYTARIERLGRLTTRVEKSDLWRIFAPRFNQSGACSSSDVITSGGRKSQTTMEDKLMVVVCGYPELCDTTSYFYKNRNKFSNETGAVSQKPLP